MVCYAVRGGSAKRHPPRHPPRYRYRPMALGHLDVRVHSRSKGHSAAAAVAYRTGLRIRDPYTGREHDYTKRARR